MGNRLYVGNLSFHTTSDSIRAAFTACGEVTDVHLVIDRDSGQSRGFAFVTMGTGPEAQKAIADMNGASLDGRPLKVNEAEERQNRGGGGGGSSGGGGGGSGALEMSRLDKVKASTEARFAAFERANQQQLESVADDDPLRAQMRAMKAARLRAAGAVPTA